MFPSTASSVAEYTSLDSRVQLSCELKHVLGRRGVALLGGLPVGHDLVEAPAEEMQVELARLLVVKSMKLCVGGRPFAQSRGPAM